MKSGFDLIPLEDLYASCSVSLSRNLINLYHVGDPPILTSQTSLTGLEERITLKDEYI